MATAHQEISGQSTQIVFQSFADRILVLVTQVGKVGNLVSSVLFSILLTLRPAPAQVQATLPATTPSSLNPEGEEPESLPQPSPGIQLTPLLGSSPSEHHQTLQSLYACQIATIVWQSPTHGGGLDGSRRPVVVGLALKKVSDAGVGCELSEGERETFRGIMQMLQGMLQGE